MELKNYFKKFGIGWIVVGLVLSLLLFTLSWIESVNYYKKSILQNTERFASIGKNLPKFNFSYVLSISLTLTLLGFVPFLIGFFGLIRLFWLLIGWVIVYFLVALLESGSVGSYGLLFIIPLLILVSIIGIIWEIFHHIKLKKENINQ